MLLLQTIKSERYSVERVHMPMFIKILLHFGVVRRIFRAESEPFNTMPYRLIIINDIPARLSLKVSSPKREFLPATALHHLPISRSFYSIFHSGEWLVGGLAQDCLPQGVQAVADVASPHSLWGLTSVLTEAAVKQFLVNRSEKQTGEKDLPTRQ